MRKYVFLVLLGATIFFQSITSGHAQEFQVNQGTSTAGKRSSSYPMQTKILSVKRGTYIFTYFGYYLAGVSLDDAYILEYNNTTGNKNHVFVGTMVDNITPDTNHGSPTLAVDIQGKLHIVFGAHFSELKYRKTSNSIFSSNLSFFPSVPIPSLKATSPNKDDWTYPIIKADNSGVLHIAGSLDAEFTDGDNDGIDDNMSREFGYIKNLNDGPNSPWTLPLPIDQIRSFRSIFGQCRYSTMMNIDHANVIHALAPWQDSDVASSRYGYLDYYHYTKAPSDNTFILGLRAYENDNQLYEEGAGNVEFDHQNRPHFLVIKGSFVDPAAPNNQPGYERWLVHRWLEADGWHGEEIKLNSNNILEPDNGLVIQNAALRIDRDGNMYILLQRSQYNNEGSSAAQIVLGSKSARNLTSSWKFNGLTPANTILHYQPSIEQENQSNLYKNWFYTMWESAVQSDVLTNVTAKKIIPCNAYIQNRTFSTNVDYVAGNKITVGNAVIAGLTGDVIFATGSNTSIVAGDSIIFKKGFKVQTGALFSAKRLVNNNCIETFGGSGGGGGQVSAEPEQLKDTEREPLSIYPNPTAGSFTLKGPINGPATVVIYNSLSQLVHEQKFEGNENLEMSFYLENKGLYIVEVRTASGKVFERVVVK